MRDKKVDELERVYLEKVKEKFEKLDIGLKTKVDLKNIFVTLNSCKETLIEEEIREGKKSEEKLEPSEPQKVGPLREKTSRKGKKSAEPKKEVRTERSKPVPILKLIKDMDKVILVGLPGAGKTTTLRYIALNIAEYRLGEVSEDKAVLSRDFVPFYIELRFSEPQNVKRAARVAAYELLEGRYDLKGPDDPMLKDFVDSVFQDGRALLLLDSLDESPNPGKWMEKLKDGSQSYRFRAIVTVRKANFEAMKTEITEWTKTERDEAGKKTSEAYWVEIEELRGDARKQFIAKYLTEFGASVDEAEAWAESLSNSIEKDEYLDRTMVTPLLLRMGAVYAFENDMGEFEPTLRKAELYELYLDRLIERALLRSVREGSELDEETLRKHRDGLKQFKAAVHECLEQIAFDVQRSEDNRLEWDELGELQWLIGGKETLSQKFENAKSTLPTALDLDVPDLDVFLSEKMGIAFPVRDYVAFMHESFKEFYLAKWLKMLWDRSKLDVKRLLKDCYWRTEWRETMSMFVSMLDESDAVELFDWMLGYGLFKGLLRRFWYGEPLQCRPNFRWTSAPYEEIAYRGLITASALFAQISKTDSEDWIRLKRRGEKIAKEAIGWFRKHELFDQFGDIGIFAVPHLIDVLKDKDWRVRRAAAEALGRIGDKSTVPHLIGLLKNRHWWVREAAAEALGQIGDPSATPHLIEALKDKASDVRRAAAEALGRIGDPSATPHLIEALEDEDSVVREAATRALGRTGDPSVVPCLAQKLKDIYWWVREAAAEALGEIGDRSAIPYLKKAIRDEDLRVRRAVAKALGKIGDPSVDPKLVEAFKDENSNLVKVALKELGKIDDSFNVPDLIEALKDKDWWVREAAAEALSEISEKLEPKKASEALKKTYPLASRSLVANTKVTVFPFLVLLLSFSSLIFAVIWGNSTIQLISKGVVFLVVLSLIYMLVIYHSRPISEAVQVFVKLLDKVWKSKCTDCLKTYKLWRWSFGRCFWYSLKKFSVKEIESVVKGIVTLFSAIRQCILEKEPVFVIKLLVSLRAAIVTFLVVTIIQTILCLLKPHPPDEEKRG